MTKSIREELVSECRSKLLEIKSELINRLCTIQAGFNFTEKSSGDEIDQSVALLEQNNLLLSQERTRMQILEVTSALARIEQGHYGICEETEELIEEDRLRAVPWTRLSIEGAELREDLQKRFAR